jgi:N-acetylneuraminic acid mutarotase
MEPNTNRGQRGIRLDRVRSDLRARPHVPVASRPTQRPVESVVSLQQSKILLTPSGQPQRPKNRFKKDFLKLPKQRLYAAVGVLLVLIGIATSLPLYSWVTANRYKLDDQTTKLVGEANPKLAKKLALDSTGKVYELNPEAMAAKPDLNGTPAQVAAALEQKQAVGDGASKQLFSLKLPTDAQKGSTYYDSNSGLSFKMLPKFNLSDGRKSQDRLVYPMRDGGKSIYTVKANGLKEDIVYKQAPKSGDMRHDYTLQLPKELEARLQDDGSLGVFSADPNLYGDISYGADVDQAKVESARQNAQKDHLVFSIPRPTIVAADGNIGDAYGWFELNGSTLSVKSTNLDDIKGTFSIDPTVTITTTTDFTTGNNESNSDYTIADQITRGAIGGGTVGTFATTSPIAGGNRSGQAAVANGLYMYSLGGVTSTTVYSEVRVATINTGTGTLSLWSTTTPLPTPLFDLTAIAYGGYMYAIGGKTSTSANTGSSAVYYAVINSNGSLGSWTTTTALPAIRYKHSSAVFNGFLYVMGGIDNVNDSNTVYYSALEADGSVGTWNTTTAFTTVRSDFGAVVRDGYMYISGGYSSSSSTLSDVQYAAIKNDGTLGSWVTTTPLTQQTFSHGMIAYNGYLYVIGGTDGFAAQYNSVFYAPIYANGGVGAWTATSNFSATTRNEHSALIYNGRIYVIGGYDGTNDTNTVYYGAIDTPGGAAPSWTSGGTFTTARAGHSTVAYNGYLYILGGQTATNTQTNEVRYAPINADGSIGTWNTTTTFTASIGRADMAAFAYQGYMYVVGGISGSATYYNDVRSAPINSTGTLGTWVDGGNNFTTARAGHTALAYNGYIYVLGGETAAATSSAATVVSTTAQDQYAPLNSAGGVSAAFATTTAFTTPRAGHASFVYNGFIYVMGGYSQYGTGAGTSPNFGRLDNSYYAPLNTNGSIGSWTFAATNWTPLYNFNVAISNGYIYMIGGTNSTGKNTLYYSRIESTGLFGTSWTQEANLNAVRQNFGAAVYNGIIYATGGFDNTPAYLNSIDYITLNSGSPGNNGSFTSGGANVLSVNRAYSASTAYKGYIYSSGGQAAVTNGQPTSNTVDYASLDPSTGAIGTWSTTTPFTTARRFHNMLAYNGYMYIIAGDTGVVGTPAATGAIEYAKINTDGSLGTWASANTGSAFHVIYGASSAIYNGRLYVTGGNNAAGTVYTDVLYATINSNGTLGSWTTAPTGFTSGRYGHSAVIYNGYLYIIGGFTVSTLLGDIQMTKINSSTGALGTWDYTTSILGRRFSGAAASNGFLYLVGGTNATTGTKSDVLMAHIGENGDLEEWSLIKSMGSARQGLGTTIYNGYLYAIGGLSSSSGVYYNTTEYSPLYAAGRKARYSKLFNLGNARPLMSVTVNGTIPNGNANIFFQAAGDDGIFGLPASASTQNGTCSTSVSAHWVLVTAVIDDDQFATMPDALGQRGTITDMTVTTGGNAIPPAARLRAGKYFTTGGIQKPLDTYKDNIYGCLEV